MYKYLYFRVNKRIRNKFISTIITLILYIITFSLYFIKRYFCKRSLSINLEEARDYIEHISPKPIGEYECNERKINENLDLSIIIPAYNVEKYIRECLVSITSQYTKYEYEVLVINDGSTDKTGEILKEFINDKRIKVITQKNKGFSGARNTGIDLATGKYIMFVDSDDILLENAIEILMNKAYEYDASIVQGGHKVFQDKKTINIAPVCSEVKVMESEKEVLKNPGFPWGKVYKNELFNNVRFPIGYWFEDTIIHYVVLRLSKKLIAIPNIIYGYRFNENGITATFNKENKCLDAYWVVEEVINIGKKLGLESNEDIYVFSLFQLSKMLYFRINKMDEEVIKNVFVLACNLIKTIEPKNISRKLNIFQRDIVKAFKEKKYELWKLSSKYMEQ